MEDYELMLALELSLQPMIKYNELYIPCKKPSDLAMLILFPDNDDPVFSLYDTDLQQRLDYMARVYHVYLKRVRNLDQALQIIQGIEFNIGHLELGGHGSATTIHWPNYTIKVGKDRKELQQLFSYLEPDACIMTLSCYNGKPIKGDNILDYFSKLAPHHRVIGTRCENGKHLSLKVSCPRPLKIKYKKGNIDVTVTKYYSRGDEWYSLL